MTNTLMSILKFGVNCVMWEFRIGDEVSRQEIEI